MVFCPICHSKIGIWSDDPIKTPEGLAGEDYKGIVEGNWRHIKEIQDTRKLQEQEADISDRTTFSEINPTIPIHKNHILELRQSTEKLIVATESDLTHYFNYKVIDYESIYVGTYAYGEKVADKIDWTDPNLENVKKIKAIHIEELRCPVPSLLYDMDGHLYIKPEGISFNEACHSYPYSTRFKAYWGGIDVTEKVDITEVSSGIIANKSGSYISVIANNTGYVKVSFAPPGFDPGSEEVTFTISSYWAYHYEGELTPVSTIQDPGAGLKGSASPSPGYCGETFSFDIKNITSLNAKWQCDFNKTLYHYSCIFIRCIPLPKGEFENMVGDEVLDWIPVESYPEGSPCPNPEGLTSGNFRRRWQATEGWRIGHPVQVCDDFYFSFRYYYHIQGNWSYELVVIGQDEEGHDIKEWQLRWVATEITKNNWSASFSK